MKKIMIALAAVACAVVANAAAVNWQSGTIYVAQDATGAVGTSKANATTRAVTAYLFELTATDYAAAQAMSTTDLYNTYIVGGKTATATKGSTALGQINIAQSVADSSGAHYGLILYVDTATAAGYDTVDAFVKAATATVTVDGTVTYSVSNLFSQQSSWTAVGTSTDVPEPTSGLLLLLGVAGLALKRKKA